MDPTNQQIPVTNIKVNTALLQGWGRTHSESQITQIMIQGNNIIIIIIINQKYKLTEIEIFSQEENKTYCLDAEKQVCIFTDLLTADRQTVQE